MFSTSLPFYHPFITGVLHGGSTWWFVKDSFILQLFLKFSLEAMIRQAILKIKHGAKHMFCFGEFKYSSSCISKCNSCYLIIWGGVMSFLTIWVRVSWFTSFQEWDILKKPSFFSSIMRSFQPSNLFVGVSWVIFHLKLSLRIVAIYGAHKWPKFFFILTMNKFLVFLFLSIQYCFR